MNSDGVRLTTEQAYFARRQFNRWLDLREQHERENSDEIERLGHNEHGSLIYRWLGPLRWQRGHFGQLRADIDHSNLLLRLLEGEEPLEEAPPLCNGYPLVPKPALEGADKPEGSGA